LWGRREKRIDKKKKSMLMACASPPERGFDNTSNYTVVGQEDK
jgi:hypothetical protein